MALAGDLRAPLLTEPAWPHVNGRQPVFLLDAASAGKPISGPAKTRLLRAVNHVLEQKKKSATDLKTLF